MNTPPTNLELCEMIRAGQLGIDHNGRRSLQRKWLRAETTEERRERLGQREVAIALAMAELDLDSPKDQQVKAIEDYVANTSRAERRRLRQQLA